MRVCIASGVYMSQNPCVSWQYRLHVLIRYSSSASARGLRTDIHVGKTCGSSHPHNKNSHENVFCQLPKKTKPKNRQHGFQERHCNSLPPKYKCLLTGRMKQNGSPHASLIWLLPDIVPALRPCCRNTRYRGLQKRPHPSTVSDSISTWRWRQGTVSR